MQWWPRVSDDVEVKPHDLARPNSTEAKIDLRISQGPNGQQTRLQCSLNLPRRADYRPVLAIARKGRF
ncbi:MAG: hypothetical protein VYB93_00895 [Pseudomonadota bacterium]|nr:hypothetical protein [Pseudomonadota bacterium]